MRKVSTVILTICTVIVAGICPVSSFCAQETNKNILPPPPAAQKSRASSSKNKEKSLIAWLNSEAYAETVKPRNGSDEKRMLRKRWKELLGIDIFMPYFKAKEMEKWVRKKASVRILKLKGSPQFKDNQIKYIFKIRF